MSQPRRFTSQKAATSTGPGRAFATRAHPQIGLFVYTDDQFDPTTDDLELRVEVSPDETRWSSIDNASPTGDDVMFLDASDFGQTEDEGGNTVYAAYSTYHNAPIEHARTNIVTHSGGFEVTTELYLSGWTQRGASFNHLYDGTDSK